MSTQESGLPIMHWIIQANSEILIYHYNFMDVLKIKNGSIGIYYGTRYQFRSCDVIGTVGYGSVYWKRDKFPAELIDRLWKLPTGAISLTPVEPASFGAHRESRTDGDQTR